MSIPNYHWYVSVNDGLLHAGGPLKVSVVPVSYDLTSGMKQPMSVSDDEIEIVLEPDSKPGSEFVIPLAGYYVSDGTRGNLVVHLRALGPATEHIVKTRSSSNTQLSRRERVVDLIESPTGHALGLLLGCSSAVAGLGALVEGSVISAVALVLLSVLIVLGATDKEN